MEKDLPENDVPKPLFTLDLGSNGGVVGPLTYLGIKAWLTREVDYWTEIQGDKSPFREDGISENQQNQLLEHFVLESPSGRQQICCDCSGGFNHESCGRKSSERTKNPSFDVFFMQTLFSPS